MFDSRLRSRNAGDVTIYVLGVHDDTFCTLIKESILVVEVALLVDETHIVGVKVLLEKGCAKIGEQWNYVLLAGIERWQDDVGCQFALPAV